MAHSSQHHDPSGAAHHGHYIIPIKVLGTVFGVLVFLTVITVITSRIDLGAMNVPLALAIAITKALLVVAFFMALKYDNAVNTLVFSIGAVFVLVFLAFTLADTALRGSLGIMDEGTIADQQRAEEALRAQDPGAGALVAAATDTTAADPAVPIDAAAIFTTYACNTCHSFDGSVGAGPTLQGIASRQTREEVTQSIVDPDAVIVEGFAPGVMGATLNALGFYDRVSDAEMEALVDYLMEQ